MNWDETYGDDLIEALIAINDKDVCRRFLLDLCTRNELMLMRQRYAVARMLTENRTYQEIADVTGASTATISRVSRALNYGEGGYMDVIQGQNDADS